MESEISKLKAGNELLGISDETAFFEFLSKHDDDIGYMFQRQVIEATGPLGEFVNKYEEMC